MDDRTEQRILEKAQYVRGAVTVLAEKRDTLTFDAYQANREERDVVEREFETTIEACIDIGRMVLKANGDELPSTNAGIFRELGTRGILDSDTAPRMAQAAGFRNILSHQYGNEINDEDVYNFLQQELPLFHTYLSQIREYLNE
jgi:uncharacterized protein YutE (UPF0331/DUF86 family)